MILTVTLNAAIDKRYVVEDFKIGEVNRVRECSYVPGGKGLNEVSAARTGNVYPAEHPGQWGEGVGGYIFVWENDVRKLGVTNQDVDQRGFAVLASIDIISAERSVPIVLAVTAEE